MSDLVGFDVASAFAPALSLSCSPTVFAAAISDASAAVIDILQWDPTLQTTTERYNGTGTDEMVVNRSPITAISSIMIGPTYTVDLTKVIFDKSSIIWQCGHFCRGLKNVSITYTAGLNPIPGAIQRATLYTLNAMLQAPNADPNATGENYLGVLSRQFWPTGPGSVPPQALSLLNPWIKKYLAS